MKQKLSEQECLDECSKIMKCGALLLRQAACFCTLFCQSYSHLKEKYAEDDEFTIGSERLLKAIFGRKDDDNDFNDETD